MLNSTLSTAAPSVSRSALPSAPTTEPTLIVDGEDGTSGDGDSAGEDSIEDCEAGLEGSIGRLIRLGDRSAWRWPDIAAVRITAVALSAIACSLSAFNELRGSRGWK